MPSPNPDRRPAELVEFVALTHPEKVTNCPSSDPSHAGLDLPNDPKTCPDFQLWHRAEPETHPKRGKRNPPNGGASALFSCIVSTSRSRTICERVEK